MSDTASLSATRPSEDRAIEQRFDMFQTAVSIYDPNAPSSSHLRSHQVEAMGAFCQTVSGLSVDEFAAGTGIGIIMPTGSGKTVMAGEIMRLLKDGASTFTGIDELTLRALMLMPRHSISNQTIGDEDGKGIQRFAPDLTIAKCTDVDPTNPHDAHLALYQGLSGLVGRGYLRKLDPTAVICDEMHHVIDGKWAEKVTGLAPGRLLVGLTATPSYGPGRDVFDIFSKTAIRRTMRDGIESGYLADLEGHLYRGTTKIRARRSREGDFNEQDVFDALINSEDNYLAARICAMEVERGRKGVLFAVPGYDRAHSKLLAKILSSMKVTTPTGTRNIVAVHVDGDTPQKEFEMYNKAHKEGKVDILCNVDLLLEGWDNPAAEFAMLMRPTESRVMAEQRLGRILRLVEDKVATVHELIYDFEGTVAGQQITHLDILERDSNVQGKGIKPTGKPQKRSKPRSFNADSFDINPELLQRATEFDAIPIDEIKISCGQKLVPYDWPSRYQLSVAFGKSPDEIDAILQEYGVLSRTDGEGKGAHTYYPPRSRSILVELLNIPQAPDSCPTISEIYAVTQASPVHRSLSRRAIRMQLKEAGFEPKTFVAKDGQVVQGYDEGAIAMFMPVKAVWKRAPKPKVVSSKNSSIGNDPKKKNKSVTRRGTVKKPRPKIVKPEKEAKNEIPESVEELVAVVEWMEGILRPVDLASLALKEEKIVRYARESLASTLRLSTFTKVPPEFKEIASRLEVELSDQAKALLKAQKLDLATVLFFAQRAQRVTELAIKRGSFF